ncbi:MAG: hypothetical protein QOJ94_1265 [Sphingomonadales bacterium]|jgi:hypothetical protein|nr:hypothetical protein [Sphingomonadales bacterium]
MIFHLSADADDPKRAAELVAALWGGKAYPFPPIGIGSWVAMAGDERNTTFEFYARGTQLRPGEGDAEGIIALAEGAPYGASHAAIATHLSVEEVKALAARHGAPAKACVRGGLFGVIEVWIEERFMLEVLTPEMQAQYLEHITPANWERMLAAGPPRQAA